MLRLTAADVLVATGMWTVFTKSSRSNFNHQGFVLQKVNFPLGHFSSIFILPFDAPFEYISTQKAVYCANSILCIQYIYNMASIKALSCFCFLFTAHLMQKFPMLMKAPLSESFHLESSKLLSFLGLLESLVISVLTLIFR